MKTAPQGGDIDFIKGNGLLYTLNGLGPKGVRARRQAVRGAPPAAAPRGARARALHVPLHRRTSTSSSRCCRRRPPDEAGQEGRGGRDGDATDEADAGAVLPPRRPRAAARDPARRDDPAADAAPGDDRRRRGQPHRRAHARQPVRRLLPAGAEPEGLPRAGPPRRSSPGSAARGSRGYFGVSGSVFERWQSEKRRAARGVHELLVHGSVAEAGGRAGRARLRSGGARGARAPRGARSRALTGSPSSRACTSVHIASAACSAVSGVARRRISSTSASSRRSIFSSAVPSPSAGNGTPRRCSSQAPLTMAKRLRRAIGSVIRGASLAERAGRSPIVCSCVRTFLRLLGFLRPTAGRHLVARAGRPRDGRHRRDAVADRARDRPDRRRRPQRR